MSNVETSMTMTENQKTGHSCRYCGRTPIAYNAKSCPACGGRKPAHRWWHKLVALIALPVVSFVVVIVIGYIFGFIHWLLS